jgi:hypothetical protein
VQFTAQGHRQRLQPTGAGLVLHGGVADQVAQRPGEDLRAQRVLLGLHAGQALRRTDQSVEVGHERIDLQAKLLRQAGELDVLGDLRVIDQGQVGKAGQAGAQPGK